MMVWVLFIAAGLVFASRVEKGEVKPLFLATATPTRTFASLELEGQTYFELGKLDCEPEKPNECAIGAYRSAVEIDPDSPHLLAELARVQAYSAVLLSTDEEQLTRLDEALQTARRAVEVAPDESSTHALYAFSLDWYASNLLVTADERQKLLLEAEREAQQAINMDQTNILALGIYAEILLDQAKWEQAQQIIQEATSRPGADKIMDIHRINGLVAEYFQEYQRAIEEYEKAAEITPNLTFLYIRIGHIYRHLGNQNPLSDNYEKALENYGKAVAINERLGINDPNPYVAIANTYTQKGEFFAAVLNVRLALEKDPADPKVFAQLGMVYHRSKNYEGAIEAFHCALEGCTIEEACLVRQSSEECDVELDIGLPVQDPMALSDSTVAFYYTYGSVLAGLHKPSRPLCSDAIRVLSMVREKYAADPSIMSIVQAGEDICTSVVVK